MGTVFLEVFLSIHPIIWSFDSCSYRYQGLERLEKVMRSNLQAAYRYYNSQMMLDNPLNLDRRLARLRRGDMMINFALQKEGSPRYFHLRLQNIS